MAFRPMIMQDIVNKICPGGWCGVEGREEEEEVVEIPVRSVSFSFFSFSLSLSLSRGGSRRGKSTESVVKAVIKALLLTCRSRGFLLAHGEGRTRRPRSARTLFSKGGYKMLSCKVGEF